MCWDGPCLAIQLIIRLGRKCNGPDRALKFRPVHTTVTNKHHNKVMNTVAKLQTGNRNDTSPAATGSNNNNNNNNNQDNVYGAVIMAEPLREFTWFI